MTRLREKFVVDAKGKRVAVIVPLRRYQKLLEDLHDLAAIVERRSEPSVSFDETIKKARGLLKGIDTSLESESGRL